MRLIQELKRRHVFRVATGYIALSWLAIQIAETVLPAFGLADAVRMVVLVAIIGFIPVLAFAWVFELTPEGFKLDREVNRDSEAVRQLDSASTGWQSSSWPWRKPRREAGCLPPPDWNTRRQGHSTPACSPDR